MMKTDNSSGPLIVNGFPFIDDKEVIGKWEFYDAVSSEEQFNVKKPKPIRGEKGFHEIYFLPNGQKYWIFEGWTKGLLFVHYGGDEPVIEWKYKLRQVNNDFYMLLEASSGNTDEQSKYI